MPTTVQPFTPPSSEGALCDFDGTCAFKKINPSFKKEWVNQYWVYRTPFAQPVPGVNHSRNLLKIETPIKGLFLASMSQIYPWDRGTNFAVSFAHQAVHVMQNAVGNS